MFDFRGLASLDEGYLVRNGYCAEPARVPKPSSGCSLDLQDQAFWAEQTTSYVNTTKS